MNNSIETVLNEMNLESLEAAYQYCLDNGIDSKALVLETQNIAFDTNMIVPSLELMSENEVAEVFIGLE